MILGNVHKNTKEELGSVLQGVVRFLREKEGTLEDGRHELGELGEGVYAMVMEYAPKTAEELRYESHVLYADVQYIIDGGEEIWVAPVEGLEVTEDKLAENDVRFHAEPGKGEAVRLEAGDYLYLPPEDAHKPQCGCGFERCRKCVVKIPVGLL